MEGRKFFCFFFFFLQQKQSNKVSLGWCLASFIVAPINHTKNPTRVFFNLIPKTVVHKKGKSDQKMSEKLALDPLFVVGRNRVGYRPCL